MKDIKNEYVIMIDVVNIHVDYDWYSSLADL